MKRILGTDAMEYLPALGLWAITALYLATAYTYKPTVRAAPAGVAWIVLILLSLDLASRTQTRIGRALTRWLNPAPLQPNSQPPPVQRQVAAVLWLAGLAALLVLIGVLAGVPVYLFAALRWHGRRSYRACVIAAAGATLFVWLLFSVVLRIGLYPGLLFGGA